MSTSTPSQGTHFSDGVRVGPILGTTFTRGTNVLTPSVMVSSPIDQLPPGIFATPSSLVDLTPAPESANSIATTQTPGAASYLNLVTTNSINAKVVTYQGIPNVLKLDCARNITISGGANAAQTIFFIFGWDEYGVPLTEQITLPPNVASTSLAKGNKAFRYIQSVRATAGTGAAITVGTGSAIGLPYFVGNEGYLGIASWNGDPSVVINTTTLKNDPIATTSGSSVVKVDLATNSLGIAARDYVVGQTVAFGLPITTTGGVVFNKLNVKTTIVALDYINNTISFDARMVAGATVGAGGGNLITLMSNSAGAVADQRVATATTRDVRGTYTPQSPTNGVAHLTYEYYNASGDTRNYNAASNTNPTYINTNAILVNNNSNVVTVFAFDHRLTDGENVTIAGAIDVGGITAPNLNITAPVTILDEDTFTYVANAPATSSAFGGGSGVNFTPGIGNLYQSTVGRFGVPQYNLTPRP